VLNVEFFSRSAGVGDVVANMGMISGVDPQPIGTTVTLTVDVPSVDPVFMPEYDMTFGDEWAENSVNDRPVPKLSSSDKILLQRALAKNAPEVPDCQNLSQAHRAVTDGLRFNDSVPIINHDYGGNEDMVGRVCGVSSSSVHR
jgi:hypothetical protein